MRRLLALAAVFGATARADEPAPAPRPVLDPAVAAARAFFADLQRGEVKAAHARVKGWMQPTFADPGLFARHWDRLLHAHGPLVEVTEVGRNGPMVGGQLKFQRQGYVFSTTVTPAGKLDQLHLIPYPVGGAMLLRASHGIPVTADNPKAPADGLVTFAVPGLHAGQVPLSLQVTTDPPSALKAVKLRKRDDGLNWLCEVLVNPGKDGAVVFWESAILVRATETEPIHGGRPPATKPEAPPEAARWLRPTACVQSDDPGIVAQANRLWTKKPEVGDYARAVAEWVSNNRGTGKPFLTLDAKAALGCGGSCTSRANLAAALLRARGIPARTVSHLPTWAGPLYVHWLTEYWHPGTGWQMIEPSRGDSCPNRSELAVLNVATPEDEDESVWPNRRSGVMSGAPRLSSREIDGPIRTTGFMGADLRTWGLALPLADLNGETRYPDLSLRLHSRRWLMLLARPGGVELFDRLDRLARWVDALPGVIHDARVEKLWAAAREAHAGLTVNDAKRQALTKAAQDGGLAGLTAAVVALARTE